MLAACDFPFERPVADERAIFVLAGWFETLMTRWPASAKWKISGDPSY